MLKLIVATDSIEQNKEMYRDCIKNIRWRCLGAILFSEFAFVGARGRVSMILDSLFPVRRVKRRLAIAAKALAEDTME